MRASNSLPEVPWFSSALLTLVMVPIWYESHSSGVVPILHLGKGVREPLERAVSGFSIERCPSYA